MEEEIYRTYCTFNFVIWWFMYDGVDSGIELAWYLNRVAKWQYLPCKSRNVSDFTTSFICIRNDGMYYWHVRERDKEHEWISHDEHEFIIKECRLAEG